MLIAKQRQLRVRKIFFDRPHRRQSYYRVTQLADAVNYDPVRLAGTARANAAVTRSAQHGRGRAGCLRKFAVNVAGPAAQAVFAGSEWIEGLQEPVTHRHGKARLRPSEDRIGQGRAR